MEQSHSDDRSRRSAAVVHIAAVALAVIHLAVWSVWRPSQRDVTLWHYVLLSALKILVFVVMLAQLRRLHVLIGRGTVPPRRAMAGWTLGLVAALAALTPIREEFASTFDGVSTELVRPSQEIGYPVLTDDPSDEQLRHRHFVVQWQRGEILGIEALLATIVALSHVVLARKYGQAAGMRSVLLAGALTVVWCHWFGFVFGITLHSYDTFYLGAMAGPLGFDLLVPIALYPTTPVAAPFYVAFALSSWAIAAGRTTPARERSSPQHPTVVAQPNG